MLLSKARNGQKGFQVVHTESESAARRRRTGGAWWLLLAAGVLVCGLVAGCAQAGQSSPAEESASSDFVDNPSDVDDRAERAAEEKRQQQEREAAWRARFPVDDYSNTLLIGDSLMQNASASLSEAMPGVAINADAGRTLETGGVVLDDESPDAGILDQVRNDDGSYARYVIGAGNNDGGGMPIEAAEEIVDCLGPDKEIYFVTMCSLINPGATTVTNETIDVMVERYPNVHKIDWHGFLEGRESDFLSDGIHVYRDCEPDYAAFIKEGLDVVY